MIDSAYTIEPVTPQASPETFRQVARLHRDEIRAGFLSSLGEEFLRRLYRALTDNPDVFLLAARQNGETLGFLCGAESTAGVYRRFLWRNAWRVAPVLVRKAFSPATVGRVLETALYPFRTRTDDLPGPEILNFCVSSRQQRRGIGRRLFAAACGEFARRGIDRIRIVTGVSQVSAQRFYESLGARRVREIEIHAGTRSIVYVYDIAAAEQRAAA